MLSQSRFQTNLDSLAKVESQDNVLPLVSQIQHIQALVLRHWVVNMSKACA